MALQPGNVEDTIPAPTQGAKTLTPKLVPATPYVSQKVTMTVTADSPVDVTTQGQWLEFLLTSPNQGFVGYPSLESQQWQDISTSESGPWSCTAIVQSDSADPLSWTAGLHMVEHDGEPTLATPPGQPLLMGTGKLVPFLIGRPHAFKPVTTLTPPTTNGTNQLECTFQITDANGNQIANPGGAFTTLFSAYGVPLAEYFAFYVGDTPETSRQVTTVTSDKTVVAVDTLQSDQTTFKCWMVPQPNVNGVVKLEAGIGGYDFNLGTLVIAETEIHKGGINNYLPPLCLRDGDNPFTFDKSDPALHLRIDASQMVKDALEQGDQLLLVINGQVCMTAGVATFDVNNPEKLLFTVQFNEPLLQIGGVGQYGENYVQYLMWRPVGEGAPPPTPILSPMLELALTTGGEGDQPQPGPSIGGNSGYGAPCIFELPVKTTLESATIAAGIHAQVTWNGPNHDNDDTSNWTPQAGDVIEVDLWLNGWGPDGVTQQHGTPTTSYTLTAADLLNGAKYVLIPLQPDWFSNYGNQGATGVGTSSSLQMQYKVSQSYSKVYTCNFNTIEPGSGLG